MISTIFKEHRKFGKQIFLLAKNELIKTYKGAIIGPFWAVVKPAFTIFVYWFAFNTLRKGREISVYMGGNETFTTAFFTFMFIGIIPWFFIQDSILQGTKTLRNNRQFITKVKFPVSTILTYTGISRLYVHMMLMTIMYIFVLIVVGPNLQFFFYCPLMFFFFLFLSWSTAPMAAFSKDFESLVVSVMAGIFWLSGIMYDSYDPKVFGEVGKFLMMLNPVNFFVNGYRNAFLYHRGFWVYKTELVIFLAEFLAVFLIGAFNYNRLRKKLPDVL